MRKKINNTNRINKISYSSEDLIKCYNKLFDNALGVSNMMAMEHNEITEELQVTYAAKKFDCSITNYPEDPTSFEVTVCPWGRKGNTYYDVESEVRYGGTYMATPYCILKLAFIEQCLTNDFLMLFCRT